MKALEPTVRRMIHEELENLPEKYANTNFNSTHEGLAVIQEEFEELKDEVFFGHKRCIKELHQSDPDSGIARDLHKHKMRKEAVQIAAMCVRFIQELT